MGIMGIENNTIALNISGSSPYIEGIARAVISPGMLLKRPVFVPHNNEEAAAEPIFAVENIYEGLTIDDDYAIGSIVYARVCRPGDIILAYIGGVFPSVTGASLDSNGDGSLRVIATPAPGAIIAKALILAVSGSRAPVRIK